MSCYRFQKTFRRETDAGQVFHWLRLVFANHLQDAVAGALTTVYLPRVLAATSNPEPVQIALQRSQLEFEHWLSLVETTAQLAKPPPVRVRVNLQLPLDNSDLGKTLSWLAETGAMAVDDAIIDAVKLLFLPLAKAAWADPELGIVIAKTRLMFRQRLDLPGAIRGLPPPHSVQSSQEARIAYAPTICQPVGITTHSPSPEPDLELNLDFDF